MTVFFLNVFFPFSLNVTCYPPAVAAHMPEHHSTLDFIWYFLYMCMICNIISCQCWFKDGSENPTVGKHSVFVSSLVPLSNKPHQLNTFLFCFSPCSITCKLVPWNPHLHHSLRAFLRFISDIRRTFPRSVKLAHLWGNYTQWFVVLIDPTAQFLGARTVWSFVSAPLVRCGLWHYLLTFLTL